MPDLDEFRLAKLAREMAMNIRKYNDIFADYNIDEVDYYEIEKIPFYQKAKEQYTLEWNSTLSVKDRVALISASYVEEALPVLGARMMDKQEPLPAATDVAKFMAKNAGLGEQKPNSNASDRFIITINLGADVDGKQVIEKYDKSIAIDANDLAPAATSHTAPTESPHYSHDDKLNIPQFTLLSRSTGTGERTAVDIALEALMESE